MTEAMEYEDEQLVEEQLVEEPLEGEEDDFEDIDEEGDIAADYLEELLDIVDMDGDIDIEVRNNRIYLSVVNDDDDNEELRHLVGRHGEVLEALQELVRLSVLAGNGTRSRLILDIAGYRAERREQLEKIAADAIEKVRTTGRDEHMKPLSPYERKVVHDVVAAAGLYSESEGEFSSRGRSLVWRLRWLLSMRASAPQRRLCSVSVCPWRSATCSTWRRPVLSVV